MKLISRARGIPARFVRTRYRRRSAERLRREFGEKCRAAGFLSPVFVLSLDCDTDRDIEIGWEVFSGLQEIGITPVYAVPGQLLEAGADVYRRIHAAGATFINHGYRRHTTLRDGVYESFFFYDEEPPEVVRDDIRRGHEAVVAVLGSAPRGFRTPHFASFQRDYQLRWLHRQLQPLGYTYSSSTMPLQGLRRGPLFRDLGVLEIPVTGRFSDPLQILDSWSFRYAPGREVAEDDYGDEVRSHAAIADAGHAHVINLYADPSQVHGWDGFFSAMDLLRPYAVPSFERLMGQASP